MVEQKLVAMVMGENCEKYLEMCFESCKGADYIWYIDGGSTDKSLEIAEKYCKDSVGNSTIIQSKWDNNVIGMNGIQRNIYLNRLIHAYNDGMTWCCCVDADEVIDDDGITKLKEFIQTVKDGAYSVRMEHLIGDILHVDATREKHYVPHRLFKIREGLVYPESAHPVLGYEGWKTEGQEKYCSDFCDATVIWHLAYILQEAEMFKERYIDNIKKSNIHTKEFLDGWYSSHLTGKYPKREIKPEELPRILLEHFMFNKDMFYFTNRNIEVKNTIMTKQWADYFRPESVLDLGCGKGCYLYFWKWFCDTCRGIELSQWAVDNAFCNDIQQGDISESKNYYYTDLITAIDVLEHLTDEQLDKTLKNMFNYGQRFLFSIPYKGDPNLLADKTHKQFKTMQEWITKIESYGIKTKLPPQDWLYAHQLLIGEKQ